HDVQSPTKHNIFKRRRYKSFYININKEKTILNEILTENVTNYRFKYLTPTGRKFPSGKFNQKFNISVSYRFSQKSIDHLKRK
ncbi:hypothetical protein HID58_000378, partial [Brassica napus]